MTKAGHRRVADGPDGLIVDGRPEALREDVHRALLAAGTERLDLLLLHMPDPAVPVEASFHALVDLQREGLVRDVGLSNVRRSDLEEVAHLGVVAAVENQFSLQPHRVREGLPVERAESDPVREWCREHGALFLAYSPLGGGRRAVQELAARLPAVGAAARRHRVSAARVALAWLILRHEGLLPVVGASRQESALDSTAAAHLVLEPDELRAIDLDLERVAPPGAARPDPR